MQVGWVKDGDYWYYMNEDSTGENQPYGSLITGWIKTGPGSPCYYLNDGSVSDLPVGALLTNTTTPDGYAVDGNGAWNG